jgi:hypothetical protein
MKLSAAAALFLGLGFAVQAYAPPDLSGTWLIEYHDDNGVEVDHPKLVLHQNGQNLDGTFGSKNWAVKGRIQANHLEFSYTGYASDGSSGTVNAQAFIQSPAKLTGRMMSPLNGGTFTAVKQ